MNRSLLCATIKGPAYDDVRKQAAAAANRADLIEWRLDLFTKLDRNEIEALKKSVKLPAIFTLRAEREGGHFKGTETERLEWIKKLAALEPEYFDIESDVPETFILELKQRYPNMKLILSHHDFHSTPEALDQLFWHLKKKPATLYKIASTACSTNDALRMLHLYQQLSAEEAKQLIALCMGSCGQLTRLAGPLFGAPLTYAAVQDSQETADGQFTIDHMIHTYRYSSLQPSTKLFGLIGSPIEQSLSNYTHNVLMQQLGVNGLYVKMDVKAEELAQFMQYAVLLGFCGLSVTMPLKETILSCLHAIDPEAAQIGAVNTIVFKNSEAIGYNTDGIGALNSLEKELSVIGKTLLILGAGGAARAIAYEAGKRGAKVIILNRNQSRAAAVAGSLHVKNCIGDGLDKLSHYAHAYDVLINATPLTMPIDPALIKSEAIVMDINANPVMSLFLKAAQAKGALCIPGYKMFIHQALEQFRLWFETPFDDLASLNSLEHLAISRLQQA